MAEKKDSFTFSDKLKDSKPAPAPFSKRFSASKLGTDGKPRKTFFERTKRDAPFFIAALIVLLLLPFFVKFTGPGGSDINDTPVIKDAIAWGDPVYDTCFDEFGNEIDNCLLPQAGRSSFDLIPRDAASETADAFDVDYTPYKGDSTDSYRESGSRYTEPVVADARRAMSGAVRRTPTQIGNFRPGSAVTARGRVGTGWSGISAQAAKTGPGEVARAAKPISLQPLTAANKLGRSMTGEAALAEAERSLGAMNKREAMQALMDSQLAPTVVGRGGLTPGRQGAGVGGGGMPSNKWSYKGMKPWWWDLEQKKAWAKWEYWFKLWADPLKAIVDAFVPKFGCCILTGQDDCEVDKFWGTRAGDGTVGQCNGIPSDKWATLYEECSKKLGTPDACKDPYPRRSKFPSKANCCRDSLGVVKQGETCNYQEAKAPTNDSNFLQVRFRDCFGWQSKGAGLTLKCSAEGVDDPSKDPEIATYAQPSGKAEKWNIYQYVVVQNITIDGKPLCGSLGAEASSAPDKAGLNTDSSGGEYLDQGNDAQTSNQKATVSATENIVAGPQYVKVSQDKNLKTKMTKEDAARLSALAQGSGQAASKEHTTRGVVFGEAGKDLTSNDCVIFVRGGRDTVNEHWIFRIMKGQQSNQGRIFRENMLRQYLLNDLLPRLYGCSPDVEFDTTGSDNKVEAAGDFGRQLSTKEGTKNRTNFGKGTCRDYLGNIFVKHIGALAMEQPLAVNRTDINAASGDSVKNSYIPDLPLTFVDFHQRFVLQEGNDFRKTVPTVTNITRKNGTAITSEWCEINRTLAAYNAADYCEDASNNLYMKAPDGTAGNKVEPKEKSQAIRAALAGKTIEKCITHISFYPEKYQDLKWKFERENYPRLTEGTDNPENIGKCCLKGEDLVEFNIYNKQGMLVFGPRVHNKKSESESEHIKKICGTDNITNLCPGGEFDYTLHNYNDRAKPLGLPLVRIVNFASRTAPEPFTFEITETKNTNKGFCCLDSTDNKVKLRVETSTGEAVIDNYAVSEAELSIACGGQQVEICNALDYQLFTIDQEGKPQGPLGKFVKYKLESSMPKFITTFPGPSPKKGTCCKDSKTDVVQLMIENVSYTLNSDKGYSAQDVANLCQGQENTTCPFQAIEVDTVLNTGFTLNKWEFNRGQGLVTNFTKALVLAEYQAQTAGKNFVTSLTIEGHTDWAGTYKYNIGKLSENRVQAVKDLMNQTIADNFVRDNPPNSSITVEEWNKVVDIANNYIRGIILSATAVPVGPVYCQQGLPRTVQLSDFVQQGDGRLRLSSSKVTDALRGSEDTRCEGDHASMSECQNCKQSVILINGKFGQKLQLDLSPLVSALDIRTTGIRQVTRTK
ncbi:hypothetical protein Emin_0594 [Elusimicrobium minutum Pei191]|uniref:Uncharacterized protein n=1 Tax=Elusimicrobium minutum (strain Pei191) TaxID=445932 RepID=B2KC22_ELUMP|nr:hypothetical protein [Elusimicrobium minutum]ACC98149.1 hypothetical protein Emin_0594 [Elusimicrobium minutum Pei191]